MTITLIPQLPIQEQSYNIIEKKNKKDRLKVGIFPKTIDYNFCAHNYMLSMRFWVMCMQFGIWVEDTLAFGHLL